MNYGYENLLSPWTVGKTTFKNRFSVSPMGGGYGNIRGAHQEFSEGYIEHVAERARGGFGLFFNGALHPDHHVDPFDPGFHFMLHKQDFMKSAKRLIERASFYDMKVIQQLSFGVGRNEPGHYSCSAIEVFGRPGVVSPVLTGDQIRQKIDDFIEGAVLMKECGFAGVEVHAMHWGYLLDQFALSLMNRREDEYGGSLENRLRIAKELVQGIRQTCGDDFLVDMRIGLKSYLADINRGDYTGENEAGRTPEESVEIAKLLKAWGYDFLNVNVGVYESFYRACPPAYVDKAGALEFASMVREQANIPVICGTRMDDPETAEKAVKEGRIDGVGLGRPALADPYYVKKLETGKADKIRPCIGCLVGCMDKIRSGQYMACAVNPLLLKDVGYRPEKALIPKNVAVVGGGLAGMEAARILTLRGHKPTIYEKSDVLGGLLLPASAHAFKQDLRRLLEWYRGEIRDLKIPVKYGCEMTEKKLLELAPDAVIFATGSVPLMPRSIRGIDHPKCISGVRVLSEDIDPGACVIIVGGGLVGCETAIDYASRGKEVTLVEAAEDILQGGAVVPLMVRQIIPEMLKEYRVRILTGHTITEICDEGAVVTPTQGGESVQLAADKVIMSIGLRSNPPDQGKLYGSGIETFTVGDSLKVGNVFTVIAGAYEVARRL